MYNCVDPTSSCVSGYVLASTKTTIVASTNGYDTRPGAASGDVGCGMNGCLPALAQDGISDDTESRWSCELGSDPEGALCKIDFVFEDPQDIMEVQVAFYKGEERTRTLEVREPRQRVVRLFLSGLKTLTVEAPPLNSF